MYTAKNINRIWNKISKNLRGIRIGSEVLFLVFEELYGSYRKTLNMFWRALRFEVGFIRKDSSILEGFSRNFENADGR